MFANRVLSKTGGPKREEVTRDKKNCTTRSFKVRISHQILLG
jgi:hypothetical protein